MPLGDWATGTMLRPLRAITEFDPETGIPLASIFEGEVYGPTGTLLVSRRFIWIPADPDTPAAVAALANQALADIRTAEGLVPFTPP